MSDLLRDQTGGELAGGLAYLKVDDEMQMQRMTIAFAQAIRISHMQKASPPQPERKVIDTTDPDFIKKFKGFIRKTPTEIQQS